MKNVYQAVLITGDIYFKYVDRTKKKVSERWRFCRGQFAAFLIALTAGEQRRLDIKMPGGKGLPLIRITTAAGTTFLFHLL